MRSYYAPRGILTFLSAVGLTAGTAGADPVFMSLEGDTELDGDNRAMVSFVVSWNEAALGESFTALTAIGARIEATNATILGNPTLTQILVEGLTPSIGINKINDATLDVFGEQDFPILGLGGEDPDQAHPVVVTTFEIQALDPFSDVEVQIAGMSNRMPTANVLLFYDDSGDSNESFQLGDTDLTVTNFFVPGIPTPGTAALLGLAGLMTTRRRRA